MAKKITGIVCGVSWVLWLVFFFTPALDPVPLGPALVIVGFFMFTALISTPILIIMALIDYARRSR